jgi:hypothetical protein
MSEKMRTAFRDAVNARVSGYPDAYTLVLSHDRERGNACLRNWMGDGVVLLAMASAMLAEVVTEATKSGNLALANRVDAALESLGNDAVGIIRSRQIVNEEDL